MTKKQVAWELPATRCGSMLAQLGQTLFLVLAVGAYAACATEEEDVFFETRIRPVLANSCIECHGSTQASGGLRLDTREGVLTGGESGPALDFRDVDASLLVRAIRREDDSEIKMPPEESLTPQAVEDLTRWIEQGAKWPDSLTSPLDSDQPHWAFQPLAAVAVPEDPTDWASQPIDAFIARAQQEHGVRPVHSASKTTLLRRAYFDLIGLPPTPEQIQAYLSDDAADGFAKVIDELLASPRYGERWGRHWLDLVRYADTAGDNADYPIPQAHLYRDYVIDAFNADLPYDHFLHEQLAGDILAQHAAQDSEYASLVTATGFIAQAKRIGTRELEDMHLIIEDTLSTFGQAVMGLSLRCARCHDHKFDPLTMEDYYALYGFFASTQYPFAGAEEVRKQTHFAPLIPPDQIHRRQAARQAALADLKSRMESLQTTSELSRRIARLEQTHTELEGRLEQVEAGLQVEVRQQLNRLSAELDDQRQRLEEQTKSLQDELQQLEDAEPLAGVPTAYAVGELEPVDVGIQKSGNPHSSSSTKVPRGVPRILDDHPLEIPPGASGRLELARWLTTRGSFLTARVMVNRIWQYHFGKPLVPTPSDFGLRGSPPTHPELLDWLTTEFIASGWSIKSLHRTIMLSKVYQFSTDSDAQQAQLDSGNIWYWRLDRRRLDAESLRDTILMLSGSLDFNPPGAHPFPEPSQWRYTAHHQFNDVCYPSDHRSVYLMVQRLHAHPYLSLFNGADPSLTTPTRDKSTVPQQALFLLNNEFVHAQAQDFAKRLLATGDEPISRIKSAYWQAYGRQVSNDELSRALTFLSDYVRSFEDERMPADRMEQEAWSALARTLFASNEFFYVD